MTAVPEELTGESPVAEPPAPPAAPARPDVTLVADTVFALLRSFGRARAQFLAAASHDVEWSAHILLKVLATAGPMRSGALAECVQSDPSTVSRQVAVLVKEGLLERRADPDDGRATILVPTPRADAVLAEHDRIRLERFDAMLTGWTDAELREFASQLRRFLTDFDTANSEWLPARIPGSEPSPEGNA